MCKFRLIPESRAQSETERHLPGTISNGSMLHTLLNLGQTAITTPPEEGSSKFCKSRQTDKQMCQPGRTRQKKALTAADLPCTS